MLAIQYNAFDGLQSIHINRQLSHSLAMSLARKEAQIKNDGM